MNKQEKIQLSNIILNSGSATLFEILYAMEHIDIKDERFKGHYSQIKYWREHIYFKKPIIEYNEDVGREIFYDETSESDIIKEFDYIEHSFKHPNVMPKRILDINKVLIKNGHKPISYRPFNYV